MSDASKPGAAGLLPPATLVRSTPRCSISPAACPDVECSPQAPKPASHQGASGKPVLLEAGVLRMEDAVGAVLLLDLDHLLRNGVERFFPADGHEVAFARTLLAHALHGVQKPRLGVELLLPRMAHGAGAHLHVALPDVLPAAVLAAVVLVDGVVRLDRDDLAVLDVALQDTCRVPAAVRRARRVEDAFPFPPCTARIDDALFVHRFLLWPCGAVRAKGVARPTSHERPMSVALDVARLSCQRARRLQGGAPPALGEI